MTNHLKTRPDTIPTSSFDYEVGFKKPPKATRFVKGQSGNPKGRPKGSVNLITAFERALKEKVVVNVNGHRKSITKLEAAATQVVNKAAGGDLKAFAQLGVWASMIGIEGSIQQRVDQSADRKVIEDFKKRLQESIQSEEITGSDKTQESLLKSNERNHHG